MDLNITGSLFHSPHSHNKQIFRRFHWKYQLFSYFPPIVYWWNENLENFSFVFTKQRQHERWEFIDCYYWYQRWEYSIRLIQHQRILFVSQTLKLLGIRCWCCLFVCNFIRTFGHNIYFILWMYYIHLYCSPKKRSMQTKKSYILCLLASNAAGNAIKLSVL